MATQRYISTSFWDDKWIQELNPIEKLLYMYLLTNPDTTLSGVYKTTVAKISFHTSIDVKRIRTTLDVFERCRKAFMIDDEWIVIPNWTKHQRIGERANIRKGIDNNLNDLPDYIWNKLPELGYVYKYIDSLDREFNTFEDVKGRSTSSNYSDLDLDLDLDSKKSRNSDESRGVDEIPSESEKKGKELSQLLEELHKAGGGVIIGNPKSWAKSFEQLIRIDEVDPVLAERVLRWCKQPSNFWYKNIVSGKKFREKFMQCHSQMVTEEKNKGNFRPPPSPPTYDDIRVTPPDEFALEMRRRAQEKANANG